MLICVQTCLDGKGQGGSQLSQSSMLYMGLATTYILDIIDSAWGRVRSLIQITDLTVGPSCYYRGRFSECYWCFTKTWEETSMRKMCALGLGDPKNGKSEGHAQDSGWVGLSRRWRPVHTGRVWLKPLMAWELLSAGCLVDMGHFWNLVEVGSVRARFFWYLACLVLAFFSTSWTWGAKHQNFLEISWAWVLWHES